MHSPLKGTVALCTEANEKTVPGRLRSVGLHVWRVVATGKHGC